MSEDTKVDVKEEGSDVKQEPEQDIDKEEKSESAAVSSPKSNSPSPSSAQSPASRPAPVMTNAGPANRPPSSASVHSTGSASARTTTTSRRGGRTRARSPPAMIQRPSSRGPGTDSYPSAHPDDRRPSDGPPPPSPANPSAAAAAAAAAAKSITRNVPPPSSWYDSTDARERDYRRSRNEGPPPPGRYHDSRYPPYDPSHPRRNWPPEEEAGRAPSQHDRYGRREEHYGYRDAGYYRGRGPGARDHYPPARYEDRSAGYERGARYPPGDHRYDARRSRTTSPRPPGYDYRGHPPPRPQHRGEDGYYKKEMEHGGRGAEGPPASVKHTTRVIGGPTPIHVPRAPEPSRSSSRGAASVFRGRPGSDIRTTEAPSNPEEDNHQKILMALRTPSTSFEEKQNAKAASHSGGDQPPLSPEAPPQIRGTTDSSLLFEPQRSPKSHSGPPQPSSSIDMAPSFSLFNHSFDSIGDTGFFNVGGPLDAALQSTSFGGGPTASEDKGPELHMSASAGNSSLQLLGGSSSALTFGMSPNNSFGNGGPSILRNGSMMILGGSSEDNRPPSPSQVLDMYRSYSGGGPGPSPRPKGGLLHDSHLRGSFSRGGYGGPQMTAYRTKAHETADGSPHFYMFMKKHKLAFRECSFLLPGLKEALLAPSVKTEEAGAETPKRHGYGDPNPHDIAIAARRVSSAVCAFGGTPMGDRISQLSPKSNAQSIFREKSTEAATVTPTSSSSTSPGSNKTRPKSKYDEALPTRYYENDNRLSWEFEENPPVDDFDKKSVGKGDKEDKSMEFSDEKKTEDDDNKSVSSDNDRKHGASDQPKMRYRCKLCGQPKQNHTCPYQQSLARSIGIMIYPAVNAFTASEPGELAPALAEMNNFIGSGAESVSSADTSPSRPTPDRMRRFNARLPIATNQVTPESLRSSSDRGGTSPVSTPVRSRTTPNSRHGATRNPRFTPTSGKKRSHGQMGGASDDQGDLLFVEAGDLKPEQFRMVTTNKAVLSAEAFTYPSLPLPYAQRKRLSDNLFSLSKEVPQLTDECAAVLREAREKDLWDLAVAELMTQVVVVVHCADNDSRFEGLRRYLLTLGISC